jgi:hypothetical protein
VCTFPPTHHQVSYTIHITQFDPFCGRVYKQCLFFSTSSCIIQYRGASHIEPLMDTSQYLGNRSCCQCCTIYIHEYCIKRHQPSWVHGQWRLAWTGWKLLHDTEFHFRKGTWWCIV